MHSRRIQYSSMDLPENRVSLMTSLPVFTSQRREEACDEGAVGFSSTIQNKVFNY